MTPLCEMAARYRTDKFKPHNYTPVYYRYLGHRRNDVRRVLEIGVGNGFSLRLWEEFFPKAKIIGVDIKPERLVNEGRIRSFEANQRDQTALARIARRVGGNFDLIVDDGSHRADRQISAMTALLPYLARTGVYFIEDILDDLALIIRAVPLSCKCEVYEGSKLRRDGSGMGERLLVIERTL